MTRKKCSTCKRKLAVSSFYKNKSRKDGLQHNCKGCHKKHTHASRIKHPHTQLEYDWNRRGIDITMEQYEELRASSGGCCFVCGIHESLLPTRLAVDHCHDTGVVRGLLCQSCNTSIGKLGDNIEGLKRALNYLKDYPQ